MLYQLRYEALLAAGRRKQVIPHCQTDSNNWADKKNKADTSNGQTVHYFDWQSTDWGTELVNVFFFKFVFRYDSRVKAMEVDERPTEQYSDIGGLDQQIQEVDFLSIFVVVVCLL